MRILLERYLNALKTFTESVQQIGAELFELFRRYSAALQQHIELEDSC